MATSVGANENCLAADNDEDPFPFADDANENCLAADNDEDPFPFADEEEANAATNAAKTEAAEWDKAMAKWEAENPPPLITSALINSAKTTEAAEDAEMESQQPIPFISALIRFVKDILDPHTTDSTTVATSIVNKVVKAREMKTREMKTREEQT